jgi:hypothetical protein
MEHNEQNINHKGQSRRSAGLEGLGHAAQILRLTKPSLINENKRVCMLIKRHSRLAFRNYGSVMYRELKCDCEHVFIHSFIHSFSNHSYKSIAPSKASFPHNCISCFLFQFPASSCFLIPML